jgi:UDP-N-acetylmuramoylalanine--D-glutamate ligase
MNLEDLKNKKICLLGLGLENLSLAKYLTKKGIAVSVSDKRNSGKLGKRHQILKKIKVDFHSGPNYLNKISDFDIIFKTPGFIGNLKTNKGAIVTTPMELFFDICPAKIIAITGTKGKGTVTSLIFHILKEAGEQTWLAGNIGKAPFDFVDKLKSDHFVILELSSFQLIDFKKRPHIAVVTNLFPEHLSPADPLNPVYHKSLKEYYNAKANMFLNQKRDNWLIVNKNNHHNYSLLKKSRARKIYFEANRDFPKNQFLIGKHNQENIAAACAVAEILKIPKKIIANAISSFRSLEHHLEFVREIDSVKFYNDSASTMPEATLAAIRSFDKSVILITGGVNKGYNLKNFAGNLLNSLYPLSIMLIGKTSKELFNHFKKSEKKLNAAISAVYFRDGKNIKDVVNEAFAIAAKPGDIILFSPGFASFDMFRNSKDRGEKFKKAVLNLKAKN